MTDDDLPRFLTGDATDEKLLDTSAANQVAWMRRAARAGGGTTTYERGLAWTYTERPVREVAVAVTRPPDQEVHDHIHQMLRFGRDHGVEKFTYWGFDEEYAGLLGAWLGARGFRWGGRPHWMALDLRSGSEPLSTVALGDRTEIAVTDDFGSWEVPELACFNPRTGPIRQAMAADRPRRVWHAVLWQDGAPAGQMSINVTSGDLGVCGLYETEIVPTARTRGLGLARMDWIRRFTLDLGCRYLVTNAASNVGSLYRLIGFRSLGFGQTWGLPAPALDQDLPPVTVAFAEAVALGDLGALDELAGSLSVGALVDPLPNGMTPLQLAARTGQPESARWLVSHGAALEVLAAWDLGWKDDVRRLLRARPDLARARRPRSGKTLLHVAVQRGDAELADVVLAAGGDLTLRDRRFDATPVEWARELRRGRVLAVLLGGTVESRHGGH